MSSPRIRELLGDLIGKRLVDVTQHDEDEFMETGDAYIMLMFEDGSYLKIHVDDGDLFEYAHGVSD